MYKVLDVREYVVSGDGSYHSNYGGNSGTTSNSRTRYVAAICVNLETKERIRFDFYYGNKSEFLGKTYYSGYRGDYDLIAPGDIIDVKGTVTYDTVRIIQEDN